MSITVYQQNDLDIDVTITDENGDAVDLTGATLTYQVSARGTDEAALISLSDGSGITVTDAPAGKATIALTDDNTDLAPGTYVQELKLITSTPKEYTTSLDGTLIIKDSIFASD